ncbi:MAG: hypothetical protein ABIO68_02520 [Sphingomicrobium sp.]
MESNNLSLEQASAVADSRSEAFALMAEALAILDSSAIEPIAAARLQAAIDSVSGSVAGVGGDRIGEVRSAISPGVAAQFVGRLASAARGRLREAVDALTVPAYVTDVDGQVTYWNRQCVAFAGRTPELGSDRWCVTWRLHTTLGEPLPHDQCPMAMAIREQRSVRGEVAIAERPDGSRIAFTPYPTPIFGESGALTGAVNILIDVSRAHRRELGALAGHCRRLAEAETDAQTVALLIAMASSYEALAAALAR